MVASITRIPSPLKLHNAIFYKIHNFSVNLSVFPELAKLLRLHIFLLSSVLGISTAFGLFMFVPYGFLHQHSEQAMSSYGIG
jgi:hypothetical protein